MVESRGGGRSRTVPRIHRHAQDVRVPRCHAFLVDKLPTRVCLCFPLGYGSNAPISRNWVLKTIDNGVKATYLECQDRKRSRRPSLGSLLFNLLLPLAL
jgi:hypothetical protein